MTISGLIAQQEYENAARNLLGWCTTCEEFTRDCTEPDAEEYDCDQCGEDTVYGAEQALIMGLIAFA